MIFSPGCAESAADNTLCSTDYVLLDYLTLIGDTVDNIPGVTKCGPKTAIKWLAAHDSARRRDAKRAHASGGAVGENLRQALEWLPQGPRTDHREDATATCPATWCRSPNRWWRSPEDKEGLRDFFQRYGFKTLLRELSPVATPASAPRRC